MPAQKIAVIGAGPMGLACAYELLKQGYQVDIYERDDRIGGMSASFDFDGLNIERYYHFICRTDTPLFELLAELDLSDKLRWRETQMGFFYQGKLYAWGTPQTLLTFPHLDFISKCRYALHVLYAKRIKDWSRLDKLYATDWLKRWVGKKAYAVLLESLFALKFFEYKDSLSAAWIGTRIKRVALSRKNLFTEQLGYLEGGSNTLLDVLEQRINELQGGIFLKTGVEKVEVSEGQVAGIICQGELRPYDQVISTIPLPYVTRLVPDLPDTTRQQVDNIINIGVVCVLLKLKQPLTGNFWMNINDDEMAIPGLIEYSNLNPLPHSVVYAPFYMPKTHPKYTQDRQLFIDEVLSYLPRINPAFQPDWVLAQYASGYEFAQTVCPPNFDAQLPPMRTSLQGFLMADTSYYYPEDRSIAESVKVGQTLATLAMQTQ